MAEGYSIAEAAKLLGVTQRRVVQLLERGVLTAVIDDRRRWRVYLAASDPPDAGVSDPRGSTVPEPGWTSGPPRESEPRRETNGDQFSQVLAELRHLQERYGQALLALGEARGEVAALRSSVELLHGGPAIAAAAAPAPDSAAPAPEPERQPRAARVEGAAPAVRASLPPKQIVRQRRPRPGAAAGLAEALARAEDPSPPELPGGREAARSLDALAASRPTTSPAAQSEPSAVQPASSSAPAAADRGIARFRRWFGR